MSPVSFVKEVKIAKQLVVRSTATFRTNESHKFGEHISTISKGMKFDHPINISNGIVEPYDDFTFKFNIRGYYRIDYSVTAFINESNTVSNLTIRPSVSSKLTNNDAFENYTDFGIKNSIKRIQTENDTDVIEDNAVDSIYDSCVYFYDGTGDEYFKLITFGPDDSYSFIGAGATLFFTFLSY